MSNGGGGKITTRSLLPAYFWNREIYNGVCLWLFLNMVLLRNAIFNESISSTGNPRWRPEKGNALSLTVILKVTYCIHVISSYTLHRNIIPTTMSMFVRSVSRLPLISMPHSCKRNPEIAIITAKLQDYFILGLIATIRYISTTILMFAEKCQALYIPSPFD